MKASLVVVVVLLMVGTAWADGGAWLLWSTYVNSRRGPGEEKGISRAFESQRACEQAIPEEVKSHLKVWGPPEGPYKKAYLVTPSMVRAEGMEGSADAVLLVHVTCWPLGLQPKFGSGAEYPSK